MIDTITLMLNPNEFEILEPEKFSPCATCILQPPYPKLGKGHIFKCVQNPTPQDIKQGVYKPRLTLIQRPCRVTKQRVISLKIEFSAPKFMKGNNFDELQDSDFDFLCALLSMKLTYMGIKTGRDVLANAVVSSVHYSKNFILNDHLRCRHVLDGLNKVNSFPRLDATAKDYRNQGHMIKWHANSYEVCLYDKVKDLQQARISEKRAIEKDQYSQLEKFDDLIASQAQVLRMEIRLNNKTKLKQVFKELNIKNSLTLKHVFSARISKQILTHFWKKITGGDDLLCLLQTDIEDQQEYLDSMQASHPNLKPKDLMAIMGTTITLQKIGEAGFRASFPHTQQKTAKRLIEQAKKHQSTGNARWIATQQIDQKLIRFETTQLESCIRKNSV